MIANNNHLCVALHSAKQRNYMPDSPCFMEHRIQYAPKALQPRRGSGNHVFPSTKERDCHHKPIGINYSGVAETKKFTMVGWNSWDRGRSLMTWLCGVTEDTACVELLGRCRLLDLAPNPHDINSRQCYRDGGIVLQGKINQVGKMSTLISSLVASPAPNPLDGVPLIFWPSSLDALPCRQRAFKGHTAIQDGRRGGEATVVNTRTPK